MREPSLRQDPGERSGDRDPGAVREMFGRIARTYDLLNRLLSFGLDIRWRERAVAELPTDPEAVVLDLCGGTGDVSIELVRSGRAAFVVCLDFARPMLERAERKLRRRRLAKRCALAEADALRLPFRDGTFDAITVAFGIRNFSDMRAGVLEMLRVLRPGGRLVILEFSRPEGKRFPRFYGFYLARLLPRAAATISGHRGPYDYLARTIGGFPDPGMLAGLIREAGFAAVGWTPLTGGIACVHTAIKRERSRG